MSLCFARSLSRTRSVSSCSKRWLCIRLPLWIGSFRETVDSDDSSAPIVSFKFVFRRIMKWKLAESDEISTELFLESTSGLK